MQNSKGADPFESPESIKQKITWATGKPQARQRISSFWSRQDCDLEVSMVGFTGAAGEEPCSSQDPQALGKRGLRDLLTGGRRLWSCRDEVLLVVPARQFCRVGSGSQFEMAKETGFFRGRARQGRQIQTKTRTHHTTVTGVHRV